jgi:hypothetical protein
MFIPIPLHDTSMGLAPRMKSSARAALEGQNTSVSMDTTLPVDGSLPSAMGPEVSFLRRSFLQHCFLPVAVFSSGEPSASERSECLLPLENPLGSERGLDRFTLNLPEGAVIAESGPSSSVSMVPFSCREDAVCSAPELPSLNSSNL